MADSIHFLGDNAINKPEEDLFNFKHYAEKVQKLIQLNSSNPEPLTIGIYGKWGEGKTSFLNLIENKIDHFEKKEGDKEYLKFHFNPWRYSSEDEMLFDFFDALSKKFYVKENSNLQEVGKWISKYSKYLKAIKISATVGIPKIFNSKVSFDVNEIFQALGEDLEGDKLTLDSLKDKVNVAIKKVNFKVVVFIDDLDRLDKEEIYTILKLIKLNADFDNFIFIINLDSEHVAKAIKDRYGNNIKDGYLFLEKIINIPIHLPRIEKEDLQYFFEINLKKILDNLLFLNENKKGELLRSLSSEISNYNFQSPREVIKILNSFFTTAFAIEEEVNLKDLFWLQFIKIRNENCYNFLKNYSENSMFRNYTSIIDFKQDYKENDYEEREKIIIEFENVKYILEKLFPKADINLSAISKNSMDFNKDLKINSTEHYDKYFSFHMERKMSIHKFMQIENLISENNSTEIATILRELFESSKSSTEHKIVYKIEAIIHSFEDKDKRDFFFICLFENIDLIPETNNNDYKIRLIELIAKRLNDDISITKISVNNGNKIICERLANVLELNYLCSFVRQFYESRKSELGLVDIFIEKAKKYVSEFPTFYKDPLNFPNKSIFYYLGTYDSESGFLISLLKKELRNIEDVKILVRNFSPYINSTSKGYFFGSIDREVYKDIESKISPDFIYKKVVEFDPNFLDKIPSSGYGIEQFNESDRNENLNQFFYWYKNDMKSKEKKVLNQDLSSSPDKL